ncbi:PREDICTED: E3 ubiquitin-protein ligase RNF182-like [Thamnophis sirtalis]|uniref:E3 ubiquitin-protein ligase RNF182 n=1 Tax=Thamnophis sirtalis TaxID=35019 RepID=A0A6I9Z1D7_9SAUR|nr:PREDICTED: E3 ubiquitin-protein ligase RNF182-like [Thamnophis sirtalis]
MSPAAGQREQQPLGRAAPETECGICCESFDGRGRRPKVLGCRHQVCARCLRRMVEAGGSPGRLCCPFCRQETPVPGQDVARLPDNGRVLALLCQPPPSPELLLCPGVLEPFADGKHRSSDCLVITLLEVPEEAAAAAAAPEALDLVDVMRFYRSPSLASLPCHSPLPLCGACATQRPVPRFLLGLLGLVYFSSLPLGIYLLLVERPSLGLGLVSLVPSTLLLCIFYSLCQCLCQDIFQLPT